MSSIQVDRFHFSPDTRAFLEALQAHDVRYLIVGGEAVILYGHARLTGDADFFYSAEAGNVQRLFQALRTFWGGEIPGVGSPAELADPGVVIQFGRPPNRIDLINQIDGVTFEQAWPGRLEAEVAGGSLPTRANYIGVRDLIRNKEASGRPKDLDDLAYLRGRPVP